MARFQILSLIGGGIRGAFVTALLDRLEQKLGRPIAESFDLIAGTSTGAIIAAGLAMGKSAAEMQEFYEQRGAAIFTPREEYVPNGPLKYLFPVFNRLVRKKTGGDLSAAFRSRYCPIALAEAFEVGFGEKTLGDVFCTRLIIPTVNLSEGRPQLFRSCHLPKGIHDKDVRIADAVIASTAAPTYFPHKTIDGKAYVDGGLWAADPSMLAIAEAIRVQQINKQFLEDARYDTNEIHLLSIGTGNADYSEIPNSNDPGLIYWAQRIADVMMAAQVNGTHMPLKFLLGDRYHHLNFRMEEKWPLDDVSNMPKLFEIGRQVAEESFESVNERFFDHLRPCFVPFRDTSDEILLD